MVYVFDCMIVLALLFHFGALFSTQYMMGLQHSPEVRVVEVNPITRNAPESVGYFAENKEEVYEPMSQIQKTLLDMKWRLWLTVILAYSFITTIYIMNRRAVVRKNYKDCNELWTLCMLATLCFLLFFKDFTNDIGYIIGAIKGGGI